MATNRLPLHRRSGTGATSLGPGDLYGSREDPPEGEQTQEVGASLVRPWRRARWHALVAGVFLAAAFAATPAQAGTKCSRSQQAGRCAVSFYIFPSTTDTLRFEIRNNYEGLERRRNYVYTDRGWLDSDNDRDHSHWKGHVGRWGKFYWRGWAKYWRACTVATRPHFACTPWIGQGPRPLGSPFDVLPR